MHYDLIIRRGHCVFPWGEAQADLGIKEGRIASLAVGRDDTADEVIDAKGLHVLPGMIDSHVHLRDPGNPAIESIATGTRAAALGGITMVFDMPNTAPSITSSETLAGKRETVERDACVDMGLYVGATRANTGALAQLEQEDGVCAIKVFAGSSTGDLMIEDDAGIEAVLRSGHRRVAFHSEDEYRLQARKPLFSAGMPHVNHMIWRDEECAFLGTRRITALALKTGRPVHILHTSTAEELDWLASYRSHVSVEVLVNHLTQVGPECYETLGAYAVMNPPIRDRRHHDACWAALRDGRVDVVSSDHAPHPREAKEKPWPSCPAGLTGVQTILPIMLDHVNAGRLSLSRLADLMAAGPARIYGLQTKGRLAVGFDADLTLVDLAAEREIRNEWIASPVGWTPFHGVRVKGWPMATIVRGHVVMRDDTIVTAPIGRLARFAP
ncbi:dihydroorotase [Swaminathania salitolerans]|uniref:Dihydroorotase n=1 Tax=Swaminathania salitolerans TaxID=182838 RepID=A0A511BMQ4_9PROT|nr:dihydroorotase [Swaminathania salitolerans]GBQ16124.1 dihydroorotase [Swaminathania salitolerans LMG 21291]GEL01606.1 dihydroorotase [Swaminathania salitolerans]